MTTINMKNKRILLVRHAESEGNINHNIYSDTPDYAIKLTKRGTEQAQKAGKILSKIDGEFDFFVSTHHRTRQTFFNISKTLKNKVIRKKETPLIREQEWTNSVGTHSNMDLERERLKWGVFHYRFPGGESCADVYERAELFNLTELINRLNEKDCPPNIGIVSHGMFIRVHLMSLLNLSVEEFELIRNPKNCEIIELEFDIENQKFSLKSPLAYYDGPRHSFQYQEDRISIIEAADKEEFE